MSWAPVCNSAVSDYNSLLLSFKRNITTLDALSNDTFIFSYTAGESDSILRERFGCDQL